MNLHTKFGSNNPRIIRGRLKKKIWPKVRHVSLRGGGGKNFGGLVSHLILGENYFIFKNV